MEIHDWGEARTDCSLKRSTEILQIQWTAIHTNLYAFQLGSFFLKKNAIHVCVCVFSGQSNPPSIYLLCYMGTHRYVLWALCAPGLGLSLSTCCLFIFSQPCVWPTKPDSSMLTHILISLLASVCLSIRNKPELEACVCHVMWPTCRPYRKLMIGFSIFSCLWLELSVNQAEHRQKHHGQKSWLQKKKLTAVSQDVHTACTLTQLIYRGRTKQIR